MKKRLLACVLTLVMLLALLPTAALAAGSPVDLTGSQTVTDEHKDGTYYRVKGDTALSLNSAVIEPGEDADAAAIEVLSGKLTLTLVGESTVRGARGYAGIYVAPGAELVITGSGKLNAFGGEYEYDNSNKVYYAGGAGIGGNGVQVQSSAVIAKPDFGTIKIESGEVNATGGKTTDDNYGAGAGIGTGGMTMWDNETAASAENTIQISGGKVYSTGGAGDNGSTTGGGAGIGTGGAIGGGTYPQNGRTDILISNDAQVIVHGGTDAAGIGGGTNAGSGTITIIGGNISAVGGDEGEGGFGGAGIGGGDFGGVKSITISGGKVEAKGGGAAAGIGSGNDFPVAEIDMSTGEITNYAVISICGDADVTAYGGSHYSRTGGGAGIGAGRSNYNKDSGFGTISITENAKVRAIAGVKAQAIGVGIKYQGSAPNKVVFSKTADIWMLNQDGEMSACWGLEDDGTVSGDVTLDGVTPVWFTGARPAADTEQTLNPSSSALKWKYTESGARTIQVLDGENAVAEVTDARWNGSWATLVEETKTPETPTQPTNPDKDKNGLGQGIGSILPWLTDEFPFVDVDLNDWFYESVRSAWANELIDGVTARYFKPDSTLTVAQAIKLAAVLHQKQSVGFVTLANGGTHWYDNYVNYAVANGLIEAAYQSKSAETMNAPVTRAEFVHILSKLLNAGRINTVDNIPDVKSGDAYAEEIFAFYRAGILTGSDRLGTFHPESSLKRSEAAAILVRLYDASQRQYITLR